MLCRKSPGKNEKHQILYTFNYIFCMMVFPENAFVIKVFNNKCDKVEDVKILP